jgi:hypothetical protein
MAEKTPHKRSPQYNNQTKQVLTRRFFVFGPSSFLCQHYAVLTIIRLLAGPDV